MGTARGYKSTVVIDFEKTLGSDPATPAGRVMPVNSCGVKGSRSLNHRALLRGNRNAGKPFSGKLSVAGSIQVPVDRTAFPYWLEAMFGAPTSTGSGPYTHTFKLTDEQPSLVIEDKFSDARNVIAYPHYNGCKVSTFGMKVGDADAELVADIGIMGVNEAFNSSAYDATPTTVGFNGFTNIQAAITEGGSALGVATEFDFSVDFGLDSKYVVGSGIPGDIMEGMVRVTGNLTTLFQNMTLLNKAINGTESAIVVTFTDGSYSLAITFEEVVYGRNAPTIDGPEGVLVSLPFEAYYDDGASASAIKAVIVNETAGTTYVGPSESSSASASVSSSPSPSA